MSIKNFRMTVQYDGTNLYGWQVQNHGRTVQGEIESAIKKIFKDQKINLIGSGRTDSGVHSLGQTANIKLDTDMNSNSLLNAINGNIKDNDIFISKCKEVESKFHSRFSAIKREYIYKISSTYSPIRRKYYWNISEKLDVNILKECADVLLGEHDFTLFSKKNDEVKNKICFIYNSNWEIKDDKIYFRIIANRFLHHMVRYLVGVMIEISKESSLDVNDFISMVNGEGSKILFRAPAKGLHLKKVYYD